MAITGGITMDTRQFQKAMLEYQEATGKTFADVVTRAVQNLGFKGLELTRQAENQAIWRLQSLDWWPKYIAKILTGKKRRAIARKIDRGVKVRSIQPHYTREQARVFSRKIIGNRLKAVKFLKFFWLLLANTAAAAYKGGRRATGKKFGGFNVKMRHATSRNPTCSVTTSYDYKRRSGKTALKTEALLKQVVPAAYAEAARDMIQYAGERMRKDAAAHSVK